MRTNETCVCKPPLLLFLNPRQQLICQERRDTCLCWSFVFGEEQPSNTHIGVEPLCLQPFTPRIKLLSEIYFAIETWQHAFIGRQTRIIGTVCHAWINCLICVPKECRCIPCPTSHESNIVKRCIKWRAIGNNTVIHLIHTGVQRCASRRAR